MPNSFKKCFVHRVIDGDTIIVSIPDALPILGHRIPVRLYGIQAPELSRVVSKRTPEAIRAKNFTERFCRKSGFVKLSGVQRGKYYRLIARVSVDGVDLATELVKNGLAVQRKF